MGLFSSKKPDYSKELATIRVTLVSIENQLAAVHARITTSLNSFDLKQEIQSVKDDIQGIHERISFINRPKP